MTSSADRGDEPAASTAAAAPTPPPARSRGRQTALDMVRSLAVIGAAVAVVVLLVPRPENRVEQVVDVPDLAAQAQPTADFELVVPSVPDAWSPTSARFTETSRDDVPTWHVGYVTTEEGYAALELTDAATDAWVEEQTSQGVAAEQVEVAGRSWRVYRSDDPVRTSLVSERDGLTTVVTGSAVVDELAELAEAVVGS